MQTSIAYNENHVDGKLEKGFKLWLDIVNPTTSEISEITKSFDLDRSAIDHSPGSLGADRSNENTSYFSLSL